MGKSKPKVVVDFYYMSIHFGICAGPPDALTRIVIKEKNAWTGEATAVQSLSINQRELFGGDQKEGGAIGDVYYLPGASDQLMPDTLAQRLGRANGADCPGFRGLASIFFYRQVKTRGFYWTANTPYLPSVWATVRRMPRYGDTGIAPASHKVDVVDNLLGGYNADGGGYAIVKSSPDGSRSVMSHGLITTGRFLAFENVRGFYNPIEFEISGLVSGETLLSLMFIDNAGNVYGAGQDGSKSWKITLGGTVTQLGTTNDIAGAPSVRFGLGGLFDIGGTQTLFYVQTTGTVNGKIYSRPVSGGAPTAHDSTSIAGFLLHGNYMAQDGAGDVWAAGIPQTTYTGGGSTSQIRLWRVGGSGGGSSSHLVTGLPSITASQFFGGLAFHDGVFYLGWDTDYFVAIDATTFAVIGSVNITTLLATSDWYYGPDIPQIDTARDQLVVMTYDSDGDQAIHRIDLGTLALAADSVLDWPPNIDFAEWAEKPPSTASTDVLYPYFSMWHDPLDAMLAMPHNPSAMVGSSFPTDTRAWYYSPDFAFLYLDEKGACRIGDDANPSCIIRECLTNNDWGMGSPLSALDNASFDQAEATLLAESFGLSMIWTRQSTIQDFIQEVLDHIQGVIYVDPSTGLLTLSLIRADYDPATLPVIDEDSADLSSFSRKLWGDIVNEIIVTWTNPENEQDETITVQDDSSIAIQGGAIISDSRNYYGVRNASLAKSLAMRDLRSAGQPLAAVEATVNRTQWRLRPASVLKLTWPEYGLSELVMRVQSIDYGRPGDATIKLTLLEDVYGLDIGSYSEPPSSAWVDPSALPEPLDEIEIITLPLHLALGSQVAAFVDTPEYPEVVVGILATTDSADTYSYELWDEVTLPNGDSEWESLATNNIIGRADLAIDLIAEAETSGVTFGAIIGQTSPLVAGFVIIGEDGEAGNEIAMVNADLGEVYGFDLIRGVLDTVPRAWPSGTPVWFVSASTLFEDSTVRSAGETVSYKLLTRTSLGLLDLAAATLESYTLTERPWLPNRPADVTAFGVSWSNPIDGWIDATARPDPWVTVTWANRNRLDEETTVLAWTDASQTPEAGQTTTIEVRDIHGVVMATHDSLAGTSFDVPDASFDSREYVELRIYSERSDGDGDFTSLQYFSHWVHVALTS